jgi:cytochrome c
MKRIITVVSLFSFIALIPAIAADEKQKAVGLVKKAIAFYNVNGKEKTLAAVTEGKFKEHELYVFCYDLNAVIIAHPEKKALIGKKMLDVPDTDGKLFRKDIVETAKTKGTGWVDYKYQNPTTKKIEEKTTYLQKVDDIIFCCGAYK